MSGGALRPASVASPPPFDASRAGIGTLTIPRSRGASPTQPMAEAPSNSKAGLTDRPDPGRTQAVRCALRGGDRSVGDRPGDGEVFPEIGSRPTSMPRLSPAIQRPNIDMATTAAGHRSRAARTGATRRIVGQRIEGRRRALRSSAGFTARAGRGRRIASGEARGVRTDQSWQPVMR